MSQNNSVTVKSGTEEAYKYIISRKLDEGVG